MLSRTADHLFWTASGRATVPAHGFAPDAELPACEPADVPLEGHHAF